MILSSFDEKNIKSNETQRKKIVLKENRYFFFINQKKQYKYRKIRNMDKKRNFKIDALQYLLIYWKSRFKLLFFPFYYNCEDSLETLFRRRIQIFCERRKEVENGKNSFK